MADEIKYTEREAQLKFAGDLFTDVWRLLEKKNRTEEEDDEMVNAAHASLHFWSQFGKPKNLATGQWQVSRVYSVLKRPEPALYHAKKCLEICEKNKIAENEFDIAWAYEAIAAAYAAKAQLVKDKKK
jgi:hypothetical protein